MSFVTGSHRGAMSNWGKTSICNREAMHDEDLDGWIDDAGWTHDWIESNGKGTDVVGWKSLADTEIEPGRVGSGNLHRKGPNFRPVHEAAILEQRTMGRSLKDKKLDPEKLSERKQPRKHYSTVHAKLHTSASQPSNLSQDPSKTATQRPLPKGSNTWNSKTLTDIPFWEQNATERPEASWDKPITTTLPVTCDTTATIPVSETYPPPMAHQSTRHTSSFGVYPKRPAFMSQPPPGLPQSFMNPLAGRELPGNDAYLSSPLQKQQPLSPLFPSHINPVLVTFSVDIDERREPGMISVRLHDDPVELTRAFAIQHKIQSRDKLHALCRLIEHHKTSMIKSRIY